jgi:chemotaxis signal transduction protein
MRRHGMTDPEFNLRAAALRDAFDGSFAELPLATQHETERFLAVEVAGVAYAIAQSEVAALFVDRSLAALPSAAATCLGVAMLDGELVPVHSLAALLGHTASETQPRWTLRVADHLIGLAFDRLEGQLRVARDTIAPLPPSTGHPLIATSLATDGIARPIVSLGAAVTQVETGTKEE